MYAPVAVGQLAHCVLGAKVKILSDCLPRFLALVRESANDLRLSITTNIAVAGEGRHDVIVPKVL